MEYIITLDVGTTSVKVCVFDRLFKLMGYSSEEYELITRPGDIVELDPEVYWTASQRGVREAIKASGINSLDVKVITITTQGETLIPVDNTGKALHNAVVWLDARAVEEASIVSSRLDTDEFYRTTGVPEAGPALPLCKVLWFKTNKPEIYNRTYKFLLLEDFLINRLTGRFVTEQALMTSTGYLDIHTGKLWQKALDCIGVDSAMFPEVLECGTIAGTLTEEAASALGIPSDVKVSTGAMDQVASAIGAGNVKPGMITETTGTALVIAATTAEPDFSNPARVTVYRHYTGGSYIILPYCPTAGMVLKWYKDRFCSKDTEEGAKEGISPYALLDGKAENLGPVPGGVVALPNFAGMATPEINPAAKGVLFGLSLDTDREHVYRALLEAVGYMLRENLELLEAMGIPVSEVHSLGGGSRSPLWNRIKADITRKKIVRMEQEESTSLGAAMLGAVASGMYANVVEACNVAVRKGIEYSPDESNADVYEKGYRLYKDLYSALGPLFGKYSF